MYLYKCSVDNVWRLLSKLFVIPLISLSLSSPSSHSESYFPDFVLHGTSEPANEGFLNKLADDLSNMVKVMHTSTYIT